jgi:hypothetical protein
MTRGFEIRLILTFVVVAGASCGIPHDAEPRLFPGGVVNPAVASGDTDPQAGKGPSVPNVAASVFLVQGERLVKVFRTVPSADLSAVLRLLLDGPKQAEFAAGVRTTISPQTTLRAARHEGGTAVVDLSAAFVEVGGQEQILSVAQIVLTATAVPGVEQVRFLLEGQAVEIPRADGTLTAESLRAADYQGLVRSSP